MHEVALRGASKRFEDGTWALREVSFTAPAGRLTTLLGPSGSGKSTLLRVAAGLETLTEGQVLLDGVDVTLQPAAERGMTLLFQNDALFPHLDVLGNVCFGLLHSGVPKARAQQRARDALALVGLDGLDHAACDQLSGGQQQRAALARALVLEPAVILLDEPLSNLDARLRRQMRDEIRSLQQRLRLTIVYVTHDEAEAMAVSDELVVMDGGRVLQSGSPREVYEQPVSEFVAAFMGDASIFDITVGADGQARLGPLELAALAGLHAPGTVLRLMIRPEAWRILPVAGSNGLPARVLRGAYLGHGAEYMVETEVGELLVKMWHADSLYQPGAPVTLSLGQQGAKVMKVSPPVQDA